MRAIVGAFVMLSACSTPTVPPCRLEGVRSMPQLPLAVAGAEYVGIVNSGFAEPVCPVVTGVVGSVVDATNTPVPSQWSLERRSRYEGEEPRARLRFTPNGAGPFHYVVRFGPNVSLQQGDLFAAAAGPERPVLASLDLPAGVDCSRAHLMPGATLVCGMFDDFTREQLRTLFVIRDGRVAVELADPLFAAPSSAGAGPILWTVIDRLAERWVETPTGIQRVMSMPADNRTILAATEDSAFVADSAGGWYRWFIDGGLSEAPLAFGSTVNAGPGGRVTPDGGEVWFSAGPSLCLARTTFSDAGVRCFTDPGSSQTHIERDGVWLLSGGSPSLGFLRLDGTVASFSVPLGTRLNPPLLWLPDAGDGLSGDMFLAVADADGGLHVERLPGGPYDWGSADEDNLLLRSGTKVHVMRR